MGILVDGHLSDDTVTAFVEERLSVHDRLLVDRHIDECPACRKLIGPAASPRQGGASDDGTHAPLAYQSTISYQLKRGERYTLLRLYAEGGIGHVWLAHDHDLGRDVALKGLLPQHADQPDAKARFLDEAKITGQLEHPGIVPVYELVRGGPDQQPFYTMRFIRGRTLSDAIESYHRKRTTGQAGPLDLRELLGAFIAVCNAVAYAHSRGVIHRDLKGPNVVLGDFGEVMVLDWGLAKLMGSTQEERARTEEAPDLLPVAIAQELPRDKTMQGQVLGTPGYMSPEQAEGRLDRIDHRSDTYGLGAILYEILTGRPPFVGPDTLRILRQVIHDDPTPPRLVVQETPPALEAVCMKALARRPADRYSSAGELAREVQRFLADEPVTAYRESLMARLSRWGRRHQTLLGSAAALLLTAVSALSVGAVLLGQANKRTHEQRDMAQENFRKARRAVDDYLVKVSESTLLKSPLPGLQPLRKELLEAALRYYQEFAKEHGDDRTLRTELAASFYRVGDITDQIGSKAEALRAFRKALDVYQSLVARHPADPALLGELARCHRRIADLLGDTGQPGEALAAYREAIALFEKLPARGEIQGELGQSYRLMGRRQHLTGQPEEALRSLERAIAIGRRLAEEHADSTRLLSELAQAYSDRCHLYVEISRTQDALTDCTEAVRTSARIAGAHPESEALQAGLASSHFEMALVQRVAGRLAEAVASLREAARIQEALVRDNPAVTAFRFELGKIYWSIGNFLTDGGMLDEALSSARRASELLEGLARREPSNVAISQHLVHSKTIVGKVLGKMGQREAALTSLGTAVSILRKLVREGHEPILNQYNIACGLALSSTFDPNRRQEYGDQAMDALRKATESGYHLPEIKIDPDLDVLRQRQDFKDLVRTLDERAKGAAR